MDPWILTRFRNPAHPAGQDFQLQHWAKENELDDTYHFSKFNKKIEVVQYSEQEYKDVVAKIQDTQPTGPQGSTSETKK